MKLKIIIGILLTGIALIQCVNTDTPVAGRINHIPPGKTEGSPQYKDGKYFKLN